jgi:Arc/MetJ family transcription regulator
MASMRAVVVLDEKVLAAARDLTGLKDASTLVHTALKAFVERESALRLAGLGGTEPQLRQPLRCRRR